MKTKTDVTNNGASAETKRSVSKVISDWLGRTELMLITMRRYEALGRLAYYEPTVVFFFFCEPLEWRRDWYRRQGTLQREQVNVE